MPSMLDIHLFVEGISNLAKEQGFEIKSDKQGVSLWPTYDKETGGLGDWFALYIRARRERINVIPEKTGETQGT